jgi:hypothetical protein
MNRLASGSAGPYRDKPITNTNESARLSLIAQSGGFIPTTQVKIVRVFGTIENRSSSRRIRACTLSVPRCCLSLSDPTFPAEVESHDPDRRKFRHTEQNHATVPIQAGDRYQVVSVEIAVGHLAQDIKERCLKMDVIADAEVDGEALQTRKTVAELMGF